MDMPIWKSAIGAVAKVIGAGIAWGRSALSKRAEGASELACNEARRCLEAPKRTAASIEQLANVIAETSTAPPWEIIWEAGEPTDLRTLVCKLC